MFRRSPRTLLLWLCAALVAIVTSLTVASDLAAIDRKAKMLGPPVTVVVATRDLPVGATITSAAVTTRRIHDGVGPGALRDRRAAHERVVTVPILAGEVVRKRHLAPRRRVGLTGVVPDGMRAVRVTTDDARAARPGDRVDVIATFDAAQGSVETQTTTVVAPAVLVLAVERADDGQSTESEALTVLVEVADVEPLAYARANGILTLALTPPEAAP